MEVSMGAYSLTNKLQKVAPEYVWKTGPRPSNDGLSSSGLIKGDGYFQKVRVCPKENGGVYIRLVFKFDGGKVEAYEHFDKELANEMSYGDMLTVVEDRAKASHKRMSVT